jgi:hypothetical protein
MFYQEEKSVWYASPDTNNVLQSVIFYQKTGGQHFIWRNNWKVISATMGTREFCYWSSTLTAKSFLCYRCRDFIGSVVISLDVGREMTECSSRALSQCGSIPKISANYKADMLLTTWRGRGMMLLAAFPQPSGSLNRYLGKNWTKTKAELSANFSSSYTVRYYIAQIGYLQLRTKQSLHPLYLPGSVLELGMRKASLAIFSGKPNLQPSGFWSLTIWRRSIFNISWPQLTQAGRLKQYDLSRRKASEGWR